MEGSPAFQASSVAVSGSCWQVCSMIILFHPRAVRPKNRRFPLAILSIAAVLEGREEYVIVDGNLDPDPAQTMRGIISANQVELIAVSVMPGPQMVSAMQICR